MSTGNGSGRSAQDSGAGGERRPAPTLAQLRALVAVADDLHFRAAATALGVSQPAVSAAIQGLEAALGTALVERSTRRVLLTRAGSRAADQARGILAAVDALVDESRDATARIAEPLRVGLIPTVAPYLLPTLLPVLRRSSPQLRPDVLEDQTGRLLDLLDAGRLDAAILALPTDATELTELPLYDEDFVLLVPAGHPLDGATGLSVESLRHQHLLLLPEGHCLRDQALDICRRSGIRTDHLARATSLTTITQLVANGMGTTLLPATALPAEMRRGKLGIGTFADPAPGRRIGVVYRAGSHRGSEFQRLAAAIRTAVGKLPVRPVP